MFKCKKCTRTFRTTHGLSVHITRKHTDKGKTWGKKRRAKVSVVYCPICGFNVGRLIDEIQKVH